MLALDPDISGDGLDSVNTENTPYHCKRYKIDLLFKVPIFG